MVDLERVLQREHDLTDRIPHRSVFDKHLVNIAPSNPELVFHDEIHSSNVMLYVYHIGVSLGLSQDEIRALLYSASIHDKFRMTDGEEPGHGQKAAKFVEETGVSYGIPRHLIPRVSYIVGNHDISHPRGETINPVLAAFKDADRLERVRVGDLDISRFSLPALAEEMLVIANQMNRYTRNDRSWLQERQITGHEIVMEAGVGVGLISPFRAK